MTDPTTIRKRPWCAGCGLFYAVHGKHRNDCTAPPTNTKGEHQHG